MSDRQPLRLRRSVLQVNNATRLYGGWRRCRSQLEVRRGEILGLIGPNGAGKTTLVNLITGLGRPTRGTITFQGRSLQRRGPPPIGRMGIARTFQVVRPFQNLSVLENVAVGPCTGAAGASARAAAALRTPTGAGGWWTWPHQRRTCRDRCPSPAASGWNWRRRWRWSRNCCCSTRPWPGCGARGRRGDGADPARSMPPG